MKHMAVLGMAFLFATLPATTNYQLNSYGFGSGGTANSTTTTYALEGISGELNGQPSSTANATGKPGYIQTQQANIPTIALDNGSGVYYNKLHFVISTDSNPSTATYLIAITTDPAFSTGINYVQPDGTLSTTLNLTDYQTYTAWGGASGASAIGLLPGTAYYAKVRATTGKYTESAYGPATPATATTASPSITFSLQTSSGPTPPYTISLGSLSAGTIVTSPQTINTSLSTNGASGGDVYITGKNGGLLSASQGYKISAVSNDLSTLSEGFGAQNSSVSQTSGGPLTVQSPYNVSGTNVGIVSSITRSLYDSAAPVTAGAGTLLLKAKAASTDVAASDYQEVLTFTASANF
jgi:hypothetical protein